MQRFIDIIKAEIPEVDKIEIAEEPRKAIKISWKTNDDESRSSKRFQPIIIEPFNGIEFFSDIRQSSRRICRVHKKQTRKLQTTHH